MFRFNNSEQKIHAMYELGKFDGRAEGRLEEADIIKTEQKEDREALRIELEAKLKKLSTAELTKLSDSSIFIRGLDLGCLNSQERTLDILVNAISIEVENRNYIKRVSK